MSASSICRRRLPIVMVKSNMAQTSRMASDLVKHGHVRIGPELISDPATIVTRRMEDFITWRDSSSIKTTIANFNNERDDFDSQNC